MGLAARQLARALLQDPWASAPGGLSCTIPNSSYACSFDKHAALEAAAANNPMRRSSSGSEGVSTQVLVIVLVVCTVLTVVCVAGTLWALHRRHRRMEAQRRRTERRRRLEKEVAAGNELRQVIIPVIVLGPCGEQLQVAFDDGYLEQLAAAEAAAAECEDANCCSSTAAVPSAACDNAPGSLDSSSHGSSNAADSMAGSVQVQPVGTAAEQLERPSPEPSSSSTSSVRDPSAAAPPSLVQRVTCPASLSVLSVADVAALCHQADC